MVRDLNKIFKAYDIRAVVPAEMNVQVAESIGDAFARFVGTPRIAVGRDMRVSSPELCAAFVVGAVRAGAHVLDAGLVSTDALYYASGVYDVPAAMFTASHNPPEYNGIKVCREKATPIGQDSGLLEIRKLADEGPGEAREGGGVEQIDVIADYAEHCRALIDRSSLRPLKVAIDAGNGMAGKTAPVVFEPLPFQVVPLYFELDGTFPNHLANPIEPENLVDLQKVVRDEGCDLGIAFDGDADRCFLVDETGALITGSTTTAMVAERLLRKNPGATVLHNLICSWSVREVIEESGGKPVRTRVGHSFIKEEMARTGAIFGGEHSGHYYFRDNFRADSGMIAALLVLEGLSHFDGPLSEMLGPYDRYASSGEINSVVSDQAAAVERLRARYADGKQDQLDGLTVEFQDWWFNCRPSNTEPLLRLNLEARTMELMESKRDEVLSVIRSDPSTGAG